MTGAESDEATRSVDDDGIITVTFTRDRKLNAVTAGMLCILEGAVRDLAERDELRALIITAAGRYFTAGADITALPVGETGPSVRGSDFRRDYRKLHQLFDEVESVEKPVILSAQGPCLGIGVELSASCDFRFASPRAIFGLPEIRNIAALPGSGGISRLARVIGTPWVKWMAMAGQNVTAEQASTIGLVHAVHDEHILHDEVLRFTRSLIGQSQEAIGLAKVLIGAAATADRTAARDFDRIANTSLIHSAEHQAKIEEFRERRR